MATRTFRKTTTTKPSLSFDLILVSTLKRITEKELEREIKNQRRAISLEEKLETFYSCSEKMRNASGHQAENERQGKKKKKRKK